MRFLFFLGLAVFNGHLCFSGIDTKVLANLSREGCTVRTQTQGCNMPYDGCASFFCNYNHRSVEEVAFAVIAGVAPKEKAVWVLTDQAGKLPTGPAGEGDNAQGGLCLLMSNLGLKPKGGGFI